MQNFCSNVVVSTIPKQIEKLDPFQVRDHLLLANNEIDSNILATPLKDVPSKCHYCNETDADFSVCWQCSVIGVGLGLIYLRTICA